MKQTNLSTNRLTTRENRPVVAKIEGWSKQAFL